MEINSYNDLKTFRDNVNSGTTYEGQTVNLNVDIDMTDKEAWTPIGVNNTNYFKGTFNGNNHSITGIKYNQYKITTTLRDDMNSTVYVSGLFGYIQSITIKNIKIIAPSLTLINSDYDTYVGYIAAVTYYSTITDCNIYLSDNYINYPSYTRKLYFGYICSRADKSNINRCYVYSNSTQYIILGGALCFGNIFAWSHYNSISTCNYCIINNNMNIDCKVTSTGGCNVGGIIGNTGYANYSLIICDITMILTFNSTSYDARLSSFIDWGGNPSYVSNCYVKSKITYNKTTSNGSWYISAVCTETSTNYKYANKVYYCGSITKSSSSNTATINTTNTYSTISENAFSNGQVCYGLNNNQSTNPIFYQSLNSNKYPTLNEYEWIVKYENSAYSNITSSLTNNIIHNYSELITFRNMVNNGTTFENETILISSDIVINYDWDSIGKTDNNTYFRGSIDGQNHTITLSNALIGYDNFILCRGSTDKNIEIKNINIKCENAISNETSTYIFNCKYAIVSNCHISGNIIV